MWQHDYEPVAGSLGMSAAVAAVPRDDFRLKAEATFRCGFRL